MTRKLSIAALAVLCAPIPALAETVACTPVASVPFLISAPGIYCLTDNLALPAGSLPDGIRITSNDVVLDLNGHTLTNDTPGSGIGIVAFNQQHVTVRNGTVRDFNIGVELYGTTSGPGELRGLVVESLRVEASLAGIVVSSSRGALVTGNAVRVQAPRTGGHATGIRFESDGGSLLSNDVTWAYGFGSGSVGEGLSASSTSCVIEGNRVKRASWGVYVSGSGNLVVDNRVANAALGFYFASAGAAKYRDNLTTATTTPYTSGTDAGNNQ